MNACYAPDGDGYSLAGPCGRYAVDLSALLDRELDEAEEAAVWAHLQDCPHCAAAYRDMRRIQRAVRALALYPERSKPLLERVIKALGQDEP